MYDAFAVRGIKRIGDLDGVFEQLFERKCARQQAVLQGLAAQHFHDDELLALIFVLGNLVDGADVGMVQSRRGPGFTAKTLQGLGIASQIPGEKFERDAASEVKVLSLVNDSHATAA